MPTIKTGEWNVETDDKGDLVDAVSVHTGSRLDGGGEHKRFLAAIRSDVAAGVIDRDPARWGE